MAQYTPIGPRPSPEDQPRARDAAHVKQSLDSKVDAAPPFSVTLQNGIPKTIRHGLGQKPSMVICSVTGGYGGAQAIDYTATHMTLLLNGAIADREVRVLMLR